MADDHLTDPADELADQFARAVASLLQACGDVFDQWQQALFHHGFGQALLVAEVVVDQCRCDAGLLGNAAQAGGLDAGMGERIHGGVQQALALQRRIAGGAPWGAR
ncbi:hypothetical protein D9M68_528860 [compost metagenome]